MAIKKSGSTSEIKYEVVEKCGIISQKGKYSLELRYVKWNNNEPKYEIRNFTTNDDGTEIMGKGITLTGEQLEKLGEIINDLAKEN